MKWTDEETVRQLWARTVIEQKSRTTTEDDLGRGNQRQLTLTIPSPCEKSMKELNILSRTEVGSNLYQPRRTIRDSELSEILKMNPTLRYFLSLTLKLASNQLHASSSKWRQGSHSKVKGTLIEFLSKIILTVTASLTWRSKFSTAFYNCNVQVHNCDSSRWLKLERFSNFLTKVEYLSFGRRSLNYRWL